jgi:hypothetical protein
MVGDRNARPCASAGQLEYWPLPVPERGGSIEALNSFINLTSRNDFVLIVAWLLAALLPVGDRPDAIEAGVPRALDDQNGRAGEHVTPIASGLDGGGKQRRAGSVGKQRTATTTAHQGITGHQTPIPIG